MPVDRDATVKKAEKLLKEGKLPAAIREYVGLVEERPDDWVSANALGDLYVKAGDMDRAVELFIRAADHLYKEGFYPRASAVFKKVLKIKDGNDHAIWHLADIAERHGLLLDARSYYARLIRDRRSRNDERGAVGCLVRLALFEDADAEAMTTAARALIPLGESKKAARLMLSAADDLTKHGRSSEALAILTEAAQLSPEDREIRERLADISGDGGEPATVSASASAVPTAQGEPVEVPAIALVAAVSDAAIDHALVRVESAVAADANAEPAVEIPHAVTAAAETIAEEGTIVLSPGEDMGAVLAEIEALPDPELAELAEPRDLESIFEELRAKVARDQETKAREQYDRALRHLEEGKPDEAVANLEEAARTPTMRFEAASRLARILVARGDLPAAVEWMERAVEAPPPTPEEGFALLYELADALGRLGETARALAVLMEIEADSAGYRDVRERIALLSQAQAGGRGT